MTGSQARPAILKRVSLLVGTILIVAFLVGHPELPSPPESQELMSFLTPLRHGQDLDSYFLYSWSHSYPDGSIRGFFRPLTSLLFLAEYLVWQGWTPGYNTVSLLLHSACALLAAMVVIRLTGKVWAGWVGGLFLVAHPAAFEAWSILSNRGDMLATVFSLSALLALIGLYSKKEWKAENEGGCYRMRAAATVSLLVLLSMSGKELGLANVIAIPAAFLLLPDISGRTRRAGTALAVSILIVFALYTASRLLIFGGMGGYVGVQPFSAVPRTIVTLVMQVTGAFYIPWRPLRLAYLLLVCLVIPLLFLTRGKDREGGRTRRPLLLLPLLLACLAHSFQSVAATHSLHYLYGPSAFFVIMLAIMLAGLLGDFRLTSRSPFFVGSVSLPIILLFLSWCFISYRMSVDAADYALHREALFDAIEEQSETFEPGLTFAVVLPGLPDTTGLREIKLLPLYMEYLAGYGATPDFVFVPDSSAVLLPGGADGLVIWDGDSLRIEVDSDLSTQKR